MNDNAEFLGYPRPDGSVGVRNHIAIIPSVYCANEPAKFIANQVEGVVPLCHSFGCDEPGPALPFQKQVINQLVGVGQNPNVAAVLVLSLGCEILQPDNIVEGIAKSQKPVKSLVIQEVGGTLKAVKKGTEIVREMLEEARKCKRETFDLSHLTLAIECGGSDATSGLAANPAVGVAVDTLMKEGGSAIFTEPGEMIGSEHILAKRAINEKTRKRVYEIILNKEKRWKAMGIEPRWMSPGNIKGGLTTIEEKSLGAVLKGGTTTIRGVLENSLRVLEKPTERGLYLQDGSGADVDGITHMVAAGAQICVFTTGRGNCCGFAVAPVIKVTGNPETYERMKDDMDINAGAIIRGEESIKQVGERIFNEIISVASGKKTRSEALGYKDFEIFTLFSHPFVNRFLGIKEDGGLYA